MDQEAKFWEEYGRIYPNLEKAGPYRNLSAVLRRFLDPKSGEIWLDAGCGPLRVSKLIYGKSAGKVKLIEAVDIFLEPAKEKLAKLSHQGIVLPLNLCKMDMSRALPYPDNHFDGIGANLVLPYISEFEGKTGRDALEGVLGEMFRVLKPGSRLVWSTPKQGVNFTWVFLASLPDMLNLYEYIVRRDIGRLLQGAKILKHALAIQKKGKNGSYIFLPQNELEKMLYRIGFTDFHWEKTFARQVWVNKALKPK